MIYATSELAYYCGLKPNDFWNMTYKEATIYCQCVLANTNDRFKEQIILQDAQTDKMIQADPLLNKRPEVKSLKNIFYKIFKKNNDFW